MIGLTFLILGISGVPSSASIMHETNQRILLTTEETRVFENLQKLPGAGRIKLIRIDEKMLSGGRLELALSDEVKSVLRLERHPDSPGWAGESETSFDRVVLRNFDGRYSGRLLIGGRSYMIAPVGRGISAIFEITERLECKIEEGWDGKREK